MKVCDVIKQLEQAGWYFVRQTGSHRQFHHATRKGTVTIAGHPSDEMKPDTLAKIRKQAGL